MVFNIRRKIVRPIVFGDEVKIRDRSRAERSKEGGFPRITDGGGRKPLNQISIVGGGSQEMFFGQIPIKALDSIDHCGVALERNSLF